MIKKIITTGGLIVSIFAGSQLAWALDIPNPDVSSGGKLSVIKCLDKGGFDFQTFLRASTFSDGVDEGIYEPWNDVLARNQCQSNDVYGLIKQQDKMRTAIRDAFLTCQTQKLPQMKKAFNKLAAEIYYVRHIVDGGVVMSLPYEILSTRFSKAVVADRSQIYNEMRKRYVADDALSADEFDTYFLNLESKYSDRINSYISCENGSWQSVGDKWQEFVKFFKEDAAGLKKAGKDISASAGALANEAKTIKTVELFTTDESFSDYVGAFVKVNINGLAPQDSFQEAMRYLGNSYGSSTPGVANTGASGSGGGTSGRSMTQTEAANAQDRAAKRYDTAKMEKELSSQFAVQYLNASDESLGLFLDNLDGRSSQSANAGLLQIIDGTFSPLDGILQGSKSILDRQCPG